MAGHTIRSAGLNDLAALVRHRGDMFRAMGYEDESALEAMEAAFARWVEIRMERAEYLAWLAVDGEGKPIAGAGVWMMDWLPHMVGPGARAPISSMCSSSRNGGGGALPVN